MISDPLNNLNKSKIKITVCTLNINDLCLKDKHSSWRDRYFQQRNRRHKQLKNTNILKLKSNKLKKKELTGWAKQDRDDRGKNQWNLDKE